MTSKPGRSGDHRGRWMGFVFTLAATSTGCGSGTEGAADTPVERTPTIEEVRSADCGHPDLGYVAVPDSEHFTSELYGSWLLCSDTPAFGAKGENYLFFWG